MGQRIFALFCAVPYFLLWKWFPQTPNEPGILVNVLSENAFQVLYIMIWIFLIGYELMLFRSLLHTMTYRCTFSIFLPIVFFRLYQYAPPFLILSRVLCGGILLLKAAAISVFWFKNKKKNGSVIGQMMAELMVLCSVSLDNFFFLRHWI